MKELICQVIIATASEIYNKAHKPKRKDKIWTKFFWSDGCVNWSKEEFKQRTRVFRRRFNFIFTKIKNYILKIPTNLKPEPIPPNIQSAITFYRLDHMYTFILLHSVFIWLFFFLSFGSAVSRSSQLCTVPLCMRIFCCLFCLPKSFSCKAESNTWSNANLIKSFVICSFL